MSDKDGQEFEEIDDFEEMDDDFEESDDEWPEEQPGWARALAWGVIVLGGLYILNPALGIDLIPDNLPLIGNLDDAAMFILTLGALRYLDIRLPDFIERWIQPVPRLPAPPANDRKE